MTATRATRRTIFEASGAALLAVAGGAALLALAGCGAAHRSTDWASVREITPAFLDSVTAGEAALAADPSGRLALTWVTRNAAGAKDLWLAISRDSGATFSAPVRVNETPGSVKSYSEARPMAVFGPAGAMVVAWTSRRANVAQAFDLSVRASGDGGETLGPTVFVNDDHAGPAAAYHGFAALTFRADGGLFATWLDERDLAPALPAAAEPSASALYCASSSDGGQTWSANRKLRDSVCSCCRPAVARDGHDGIAVAYRAANGDLRDPALAVSLDGGATFPSDTIVHADGWRLTGCPEVGPALTWNRPGGGTYAWFTGADVPGVYLAGWRAPGGQAGVRRALSDSLSFASHPRLVAQGEATMISVEARPAADTTRTVLALRTLDGTGRLTPWMFLGADVRDGWLAAGDARNAFACWTESGAASRVRVVQVQRH